MPSTTVSTSPPVEAHAQGCTQQFKEKTTVVRRSLLL
jgi:hypothetical protein